MARPPRDQAGRTAAAARSVDEWRAIVSGGVGEGQRNATLARLTGHLLRKHVDPIVTLELTRAWNLARCRPPLLDDEVLRTVNGIAGAELRRLGGTQ